MPLRLRLPRAGAACAALVLLPLLAACEIRQASGGGGGGGGVFPGGAFAFRMGGTGADEGRQVVRTADGGVVIVGDFTGSVDFDPSPGVATRLSVGATDVFAVRLDSSGALQWATILGGPGADAGRSVAVLRDGRVVVTGGAAAGFQCVGGIAQNTVNGPRDAFVTVLTADGRCDRTFFLGGAGSDDARAVAVGANDDLFLTGTYQGPADFDPTGSDALLQPYVAGDPSDVFVARYGTDGALRWVAPLAGRGTDQSWALRLDDVQQVVVAGTFTDTLDVDPTASQRRLVSAGGTDTWVASLTTTGFLRWGEQMGGPQADAVAPHALTLNAARDVFVAGQFSGSMTLGALVGLPPVVSFGASDGFVVRVASNGLAASGFAIGGPGDDAVLGMQADASGPLLLVGAFQGTVDFSRGVAARTLAAVSPAGAAGADLYTARYDATGLLQWAERLRPAAAPPSRPTASLVAGSGTFWIGGRFAGTMNADPGTGFATLTGAGDTDVFLARYDASTGAVVRR